MHESTNLTIIYIMLRATVKEKKIIELIKKGTSPTPLNSVKGGASSNRKVVRVYFPLALLNEVDKLLNEKKKNELGCKKSRNSFILDAILKYVNNTK